MPELQWQFSLAASALTGQTMRLMFQMDEQGAATGNLSMNWGETEVQEQIRRLIEKRWAIS